MIHGSDTRYGYPTSTAPTIQILLRPRIAFIVILWALMNITLEQGASFGPSIAGPQGVLIYEISFGDPRSWAADPEEFDKLLAERGVVKLPNPDIPLPDWLEDTRT